MVSLHAEVRLDQAQSKHAMLLHVGWMLAYLTLTLFQMTTLRLGSLVCALTCSNPHTARPTASSPQSAGQGYRLHEAQLTCCAATCGRDVRHLWCQARTEFDAEHRAGLLQVPARAGRVDGHRAPCGGDENIQCDRAGLGLGDAWGAYLQRSGMFAYVWGGVRRAGAVSYGWKVWAGTQTQFRLAAWRAADEAGVLGGHLGQHPP